jgi:hypothetical protein
VTGASLFEVVDSIEPDRAGGQLARFLAAQHQPAARRRAEAVVGGLTGARPRPATTEVLRHRIGTVIRTDQRRIVMRWCDWADAVPARPVRARARRSAR